MTNEQIEPPNDSDAGDFPSALIHADETVKEALAEKLVETKRSSTPEWLRPSLGAALLLMGAAALAFKVISGYRHASPEAFVSVEDQNRQPAASSANRSTEPPSTSAGAASPAASGAATSLAAPNISASPNEPKSRLEAASNPATDANSAVQDDPACAEIKTEQHEIDAALNKPHSPEQDHYMQRRLHELLEQAGKLKCDG
jgi:hypothetical protein